MRGTSLIWLRFRDRRGTFADGQKRFAKGLVEIVGAFEIVTSILVGFGQEFEFDHVENDFAEVLAASDPPCFEQRQRHRTELLQGELADAPEQLLAGDMASFGFLWLPADHSLRVIERLSNEEVSVPMVALVLGKNLIDGFLETGGLHVYLEFNSFDLPDGWEARYAFTVQPTSNNDRTMESTNCSCLVKRSMAANIAGRPRFTMREFRRPLAGPNRHRRSGAGVPPAAGASRPRIRRGRDARADSRDGCPTTAPSQSWSQCAQITAWRLSIKRVGA